MTSLSRQYFHTLLLRTKSGRSIMLKSIRRQFLRQLTLGSSITILALNLNITVCAQNGPRSESLFAKDPYSLSFKDFEREAFVPPAVPTSSTPTAQTSTTQGAIAIFEGRVKKNPADYASRAILGELYLRRASEDDHLESYRLAVDVLSEALRIQPDYEASRLNMARALMAQHQFADAIALATPKGFALSDKCANLALVADCHLELGNYVTAGLLLTELRNKEASSPVLARVARFEEIHGHTSEAVKLLEDAIADLEKVGASPNEQTWYRWRLANILFDNGQLRESEAHVRAALEQTSDDEPCLILLAKILFAQGSTERALSRMSEALEIHQSPPSMALMGDLYQALGQPELAATWWNKAEACILEEAKVAKDAHAREAATFYADHDLHLVEALELIAKDIAQRQDIYTYDAHAWILFKNGKYQEAKASMQRALARNTRDLTFDYHAAKIHLALGESDEARSLVQRIANVNPKFSIHFAADIAREELKVTPSQESQEKNIQR
jgi:tetratricopeptide (TPR) repeat protein